MDWEALEVGLQAWLAVVCGVEPTNIAWDSQPVGYRDFPQIDLVLTRSGADRSTDERRYEPDATGLLVEVIYGNRTAALAISVRSRDLHGNQRSEALLERARLALHSEFSESAFAELGIVVRDAGPLAQTREVIDAREMSVATLTLTLGYTVSSAEEVLPLSGIEPIEHVIVGGGIVGPIGTIPDRTIP
jgi:hypothetical protein